MLNAISESPRSPLHDNPFIASRILHLPGAMELFRAGDLILRAPLLPLFAPAAYRVSQSTRGAALPITRLCGHVHGQRQASRSFSATRHSRQQASHAIRQAQDAPSASRDLPSSPPPARSTLNDDLSSLVDSGLDFNKNMPAASSSRASRFSPLVTQANKSSSRGQSREIGASRTSDNFVDNIFSNIGKVPNSQRNRGPRTAKNVSQMLDPNQFTNREVFRHEETDDRLVMKLGPKLGRTVHVDNARNMDVGKAFRMLDIQCARNSVRRDFNRQRFHERPGLKRKRLKSERWRKNFKNQFKATIRMVQQMKRQGW